MNKTMLTYPETDRAMTGLREEEPREITLALRNLAGVVGDLEQGLGVLLDRLEAVTGPIVAAVPTPTCEKDAQTPLAREIEGMFVRLQAVVRVIQIADNAVQV